MTPTAFEHPRKTCRNTAVSTLGGAESDASRAADQYSDLRISFLVNLWQRLPYEASRSMLELVNKALSSEN